MAEGTLLGIGRRIGFLSTAAVLVFGFTAPRAEVPAAKTPVILDTDIGDDIDDTWALVMLLRSPELDLKLVTTTYGKAEYRAKLIAKVLTIAGRTDVPVGLGAGGRGGSGGQEAWTTDYDLKSYPGTVREDGVQAMIDAVNSSPVPVTLISIGPSTTIAEALRRDPGMAAKVNFVGMQGSVHKGYEGGPACAEWNIKADIPAARVSLLAPWRTMTITPLDTCGLVRLTGRRFAFVRDCPNPLVRALLENFRVWSKNNSIGDLKESSILFDTVAVALALPDGRRFMDIEDLSITVTEEGLMHVGPTGTKMSVAVAWKGLGKYEEFLMGRLAKLARMSAGGAGHKR